MPTITTANTIFPTVTRQWYRVTPVTAGETFTVTDAATNTPLPVHGNDFFAISDAGVKVSVDAYILPFELAPSGASTSTSGSVGGGDCNVTITDRDSIVCGVNASANGGGGCISIGYNAQTKETTGNTYTGGGTRNASSVAYGANTIAAYRGVAIGGDAIAGSMSNSAYSANTAIGFKAKAGVGADGATASGYYATASGYSATASGYYATASGYYATASGYYATASGEASVAIGSMAQVHSDHVVGISTGERDGRFSQFYFFQDADGAPCVAFVEYDGISGTFTRGVKMNMMTGERDTTWRPAGGDIYGTAPAE